MRRVDLAYRIILARLGPEEATWDEIAAAEGIPKRTLQHFYRGWLEGEAAQVSSTFGTRPRSTAVVPEGLSLKAPRGVAPCGH
jgi:hypothetical protein